MRGTARLYRFSAWSRNATRPSATRAVAAGRDGAKVDYVFPVVGAELLGGEPPIGELW